jgi:hypothetical protein
MHSTIKEYLAIAFGIAVVGGVIWFIFWGSKAAPKDLDHILVWVIITSDGKAVATHSQEFGNLNSCVIARDHIVARLIVRQPGATDLAYAECYQKELRN